MKTSLFATSLQFRVFGMPILLSIKGNKELARFSEKHSWIIADLASENVADSICIIIA